MPNAVNLGSGGLKPLRFQSLRGLMSQRCDGQHDIYVAEVVYIAAEGKLTTVTICRQCAQFFVDSRSIAEPHHEGELLKQGK